MKLDRDARLDNARMIAAAISAANSNSGRSMVAVAISAALCATPQSYAQQASGSMSLSGEQIQSMVE